MNRPAGKTLYAVLGVSPTATQSQIDAAYAAMQRNLGEMTNQAARQQRQQLLDEAHERLSVPLRRSVYDASLTAGDSQAVEVVVSSSRASETVVARQDNGGLLKAGLAALVLLGLGLSYYAWHQRNMKEVYRVSFEAAIQRGEKAEQDMLAEQALHPVNNPFADPKEQEDTAGKTPAEIESARLAKKEREDHEREMAHQDSAQAYDNRQAQYRAENDKRQREYQLERETRETQMRQERELREANERVERDRVLTLNRLLSEKRFDEARAIAKTSYEFDRIKSLEKYSR